MWAWPMAGLTVREAGCKRAVHLGHLMGFPSWARVGGKVRVEWATRWEKEQAERERVREQTWSFRPKEREGAFFPIFLFFFYSKAISKIF